VKQLRSLIFAGKILSLVVGVLIAAEFVLQYRLINVEPLTQQGRVDFAELARRGASDRGEPYDRRALYQVIADVRAQGRRAYPAASPAYFLADEGSTVRVDGEPVLPMGITALADNYYCNETGQYANFATDRFGFRNENVIWDYDVDIVAVGDSYTMGSCLSDDKSIVGNIRQSGKKILNLGMGGNGPLLDLASLVEYGKVLKPKIILWNFFANDMEDLEGEYRNPILKRYLKEGYSQQLVKRAALINPAVDKVIEQHFKNVESAGRAQPNIQSQSFFEFPNLFQAYRLVRSRLATRQVEPPKPNFNLLMDIIKRADGEAKKIGAKLYFVYIPDCASNSSGQNIWKAALFNSVLSLGIPVIDTELGIQAIEKAGQSGYHYCPGSHFSAAGARSAALQILKRLKDDHAPPAAVMPLAQ
jgi:hypothetical protein